MNLLRRTAPTFFSFLVNQPKQTFVGLRSERLVLMRKLKDPKQYYERLLKEAPLTPKGLLTLEPQYFFSLLSRCEKETDIHVAVNAFYNFMGHQVTFTNSEMDTFLRKALECKNPKATHDIILNHNYLMYYPHPDILIDIMSFYRKNKQGQNAMTLVDIVSKKRLLKVNERFFEEAILCLYEAGLSAYTFKVFDAFLERELPISRPVYSAIIDLLYKLQIRKKKVKNTNTHKILERVDKYNLSPEDWIKLSYSQIHHLENCVNLFERFAEKEFSSAKKPILEASELNKQYFDAVFQQIVNRNKFNKRFTDALNLLKEKYQSAAIAPELETAIQDSITRAREGKQTETPPSDESVQKDENPSQEENPKA